jgi:hypothetical protein
MAMYYVGHREKYLLRDNDNLGAMDPLLDVFRCKCGKFLRRI